VPPTINDPRCVERVERAVLKALDENSLVKLEKPVSIGEDFAYYLQKVPGAFMLLGCRSAGQEPVHSLHSPLFDFNEDALLPGVALFVQIVLDFFGLA
jgi:metal-dependent amidase/aminoacylase/carboxypeptidase family protein